MANTLPPSDLSAVERQVRPPDVLVIDVRGQSALPSAIGSLRRRFPTMGVVIVATDQNPALMLEAMRAGVSEFVTEPLSGDDLRAGIERVAGQQSLPTTMGRVFAFVGAKGGVGTTTLAVNVATALATADPHLPVLMVDLHATAHGDAGLLLGVESKFSIVDALENTNRLDAAYLKSLVVRTKEGLDVLASPERPSLRAPEGAQVRALIERVAMYYGAVVLDVPRTDFGILDSLEPLSIITLVVNQELPTVRRAAQVGAELWRQRYGKDKVDAAVMRCMIFEPISWLQEDIERVVGPSPVWAWPAERLQEGHSGGQRGSTAGVRTTTAGWRRRSSSLPRVWRAHRLRATPLRRSRRPRPAGSADSFRGHQWPRHRHPRSTCGRRTTRMSRAASTSSSSTG